MSVIIMILPIGVISGAVAAVAGFGIGSLLIPVLAHQIGTKLAVAAAAIPHLCGTALRYWSLSQHIDFPIFWSFGLTSAAGGLAGALLLSYAESRDLSYVFGGLLILAALMELTGMARQIQFRGTAAWVAGALSGVFGGLVGNQGGIRSAAMLGVKVPKKAFIATATAIALMVDAARMPVYLYTESHGLAEVWPTIVLATIGVSLGTIGGRRLLKRIPETFFYRIVAITLMMRGIWMFIMHQPQS
ncbi:MAG: sulfite exporter TauE/SafE family protein [Thermodesulfobacteriota bacterium]|jgi:uncharacterized membrane protein YfcA